MNVSVSKRGRGKSAYIDVIDWRPETALLIHAIMALLRVSKRPSTSALKKKKPTAASTLGAPAQHDESSRKGKRAWRKNVDIEDLEEKLESLREEERTLGCALYSHRCWP